MFCLAPAKLNLFLHITGRRPDGYHDLETVFRLVELYDELTIETRTDGRIVRDPPPDDPLLASLADDADLTVRAARLLRQESGTEAGASIHVRKRIPAGGGLGGGSSDAATVLRALNTLWGLDWPLERLAELGLALGSDVPVFVHGRNAFARGRGERLTPVQLPPCWYLIVNPQVHVSTAAVFAAPELRRDTPPLASFEAAADCSDNDFEPVVRVRYPAVAAVLDHLAEHGAGLTGTGASVFTSFATRSAAQAVAERLPATWQHFVVRGYA